MFARLRREFTDLAEKNGLLGSEVNITARILKPEEAIGKTERKDFPLLQGKESLIQADFKDAFGQAFTDIPMNFKGELKEIIGRDLINSGDRALFIATLNAVMRHLGLIEDTIHCKNNGPELCAAEITGVITEKYGSDIVVGIGGFQPAIIDYLSKTLSPANIRVTDLDKENIGKTRYGVIIWDGSKMTEELFKVCDLILATGSTIVNDTLSILISLAEKYRKPLYLYGTTVAGTSRILNLERLCFQAS